MAKRKLDVFVTDGLHRKARQAYNDLSDEKSKDYETVKQTDLKVYELIPEAYRLKCRACKMSDGETRVEFLPEKERLCVGQSKECRQ